MWPDVIVLFELLIDDGLGLAGCNKQLSVQNFSMKHAVEAFVIHILPRRSWIDADRLEPTLISQSLKGSDENTGLMSELSYFGCLSLINNGKNASRTSDDARILLVFGSGQLLRRA